MYKDGKYYYFKLDGCSPDYDFDIPDFMRVYVMDCGKFDYLEKAMLRIEEEEISFMCSHLSGFAVMAIFALNIEGLIDSRVLLSSSLS